MKILFICGGLEPGKNGVGDYVRRLAIALKKYSCEPALIAINDPFCTGLVKETQEMEGSEILALRLGRDDATEANFNRATLWVKGFDPDWLSLQFVPYSFHSKGVPLGLTRKLRKLGQGRKWHIMFHELWVGMHKSYSIKTLLLKNLQKQIIKEMIRELEPAVIHTQSSLYLRELENLGYHPKYLPLFSNIPNVHAPGVKRNINQHETSKLVLFGSIHAGAPIQAFAEEIAEFTREKGFTISLTLLGRCGREQEKWASSWRAQGLEVNFYGEQSPENISRILGTSFAGISTTPVGKLEKSGAVAAMREHELPVICVCDPGKSQSPEKPKLPSGTVVYEEGNLGNILFNLPEGQKCSGVKGVARQFYDSLQLSLNRNTRGISF